MTVGQMIKNLEKFDKNKDVRRIFTACEMDLDSKEYDGLDFKSICTNPEFALDEKTVVVIAKVNRKEE